MQASYLLSFLVTLFAVPSLCEVPSDCLSSDSEACVAKLETEVEGTELEELEALRTELLQRETLYQKSARPKGYHTPAQILGAALDPQAWLTVQRVSPTAEPHRKSRDENYLLQAAIPVGAFVLGGIAMLCQQRTAGMLAVYFGAQSGFSLYMKVVLSSAVVSQELKMKGVPAAFLVTAIQQIVACIILSFVLSVLWVTPKEWLHMSEPYRPKRLQRPIEWVAVLVFSVAFALNIGLNNFSLSLLTVSLNLIIRSCLPLVTLVVQLCTGTAGQIRAVEVVLMSAGVLFAALATVAKGHGSHGGAGAAHLVLGVIMCSLSDIAAALNLVLASVFGTHMKLNPLDTTFYMAVPCAVSLLPAVFFVNHPVDWPGSASLTDYRVLLQVLELKPSVLLLVGLSGLFAAGYNLLQYWLVQSLSATHAAFAGNFNKAATIMLSLCLGLESLPSGAWSGLMIFAIAGNILAFTGYSMIKGGSGKDAPPSSDKSANSNAQKDAIDNRDKTTT